MSDRTPAEEQFHTSSSYPVPSNWHGKETFKIRVDYPLPSSDLFPPLPQPDVPVDAPWLKHDFTKEPENYANVVKGFCWEGNVENDFVVQKNQIRNWYHACWMHAGGNGREPIKGLTYERPTPALELAKTQTNALQSWAIGFYNSPGASVFGGVWQNPNEPIWNKDLKFPPGTCAFKLLFTTAKDDEVLTMKGSPAWPAVISRQHDLKFPPPNPGKRNDFISHVRLIQVDWAVVDDRAPNGWVFGTYMYNGTLVDVSNPWDRLTPVGVMWGNDPKFNQAAYDNKETNKASLQQTWINIKADQLRLQLGGRRPFWGWNGRLNGPADNFISACMSCHSTAQSFIAPMVQPSPRWDKNLNKWVPQNEKLTMTWFENVKGGESFSVRGALSADYSLQFMVGWDNYNSWNSKRKEQAQEDKNNTNRKIISVSPGPLGRRIVFIPRLEEDSEEYSWDDIAKHIEIEENSLRVGPDLSWE